MCFVVAFYCPQQFRPVPGWILLLSSLSLKMNRASLSEKMLEQRPDRSNVDFAALT